MIVIYISSRINRTLRAEINANELTVELKIANPTVYFENTKLKIASSRKPVSGKLRKQSSQFKWKLLSPWRLFILRLSSVYICQMNIPILYLLFFLIFTLISIYCLLSQLKRIIKENFYNTELKIENCYLSLEFAGLKTANSAKIRNLLFRRKFLCNSP